MKVVKRKLSELIKPERNIRMHTEKQLKEFERSVAMFGQIRPIVIDENGEILAGNGLYETLLRLGYTEGDTYQVTGLTSNQKKKLMIADNKVFGLGVDDHDTFDAFLVELKDDLDIPGFDEELLKSMVADANSISEKLQEYGTLDDDEIDDIKAAHERKEQSIARASTNSTADDEPNDENVGDADGDTQSVICPNCGEKIWL